MSERFNNVIAGRSADHIAEAETESVTDSDRQGWRCYCKSDGPKRAENSSNIFENGTYISYSSNRSR